MISGGGSLAECPAEGRSLTAVQTIVFVLQIRLLYDNPRTYPAQSYVNVYKPALILFSFNGIHTNIYSSRTKFSTLFKPKLGLNDSNQIKNLVSGQRSRSMSDRTPPTVGVPVFGEKLRSPGLLSTD